MSDAKENDIAADVRLAPGYDLFTLVPLIEDILRTRYCIPGSIFLVEGIDSASVSKSGRWQAIQLVLGDGELCIQALLSGPLQRFVEMGDVAVGCYVRLDKFDLRRTTVGGDEATVRDMVYLAVEDLVTVGWNDAYRSMWEEQTDLDLEQLAAENDLNLEEANPEHAREEAIEAQAAEAPELPKEGDRVEEEVDEAAFEDAFDAFEALTFPLKPSKRALGKQTDTKSDTSKPIALPRDWHDHQTPLKLTTLRSIPHLPYAQNWSCNVLAIVTSLSPVESSYLPPYHQRTARIADPSTSKQVHLTVFLEPEKFEPKIGSAVLLVGVKNHRFDGGSLKKYASDAVKNGGPNWWFEDPWEMGWCDVDGIKTWWAEVRRSLALK
ncbi:hypothetical protein ACO1O0_006733 [Amphichorda felina]